MKQIRIIAAVVGLLLIGLGLFFGWQTRTTIMYGKTIACGSYFNPSTAAASREDSIWALAAAMNGNTEEPNIPSARLACEDETSGGGLPWALIVGGGLVVVGALAYRPGRPQSVQPS